MGGADDTDDSTDEDVFKPRRPFTKVKGEANSTEGNASQNSAKIKPAIKKRSKPGGSNFCSRKDSQDKTNTSKKKAENNRAKIVIRGKNFEEIASSSKANEIIGFKDSLKKESQTDLFCPICQVPLNLLKISAAMHTASCNVSGSLPACRDGCSCLNMNIFHYRDFSHQELAAFRDSENYIEPDIVFTPQKAKAKQTPTKPSGTKRPSKSPALSQRKVPKRGKVESSNEHLHTSADLLNEGDSVGSSDNLEVPDTLRKNLFKEEEHSSSLKRSLHSDLFLPEGEDQDHMSEQPSIALNEDLDANIDIESASLTNLEDDIIIKNEPASQKDEESNININTVPESQSNSQEDFAAHFSKAQVTIHYDLNGNLTEQNLNQKSVECSASCPSAPSEGCGSLQATCNIIIKSSGIGRKEAMLRSPLSVTLMINQSGWEALEIKGRQSANLGKLDVSLCQCGHSTCVCIQVSDPAILKDVKFNPQECGQHDKFFASMVDLGLKSRENYIQPVNDDIMLKKINMMQSCHQVTISSAVTQEEGNILPHNQPHEAAENLNDDIRTSDSNDLMIADSFSRNPDYNQNVIAGEHPVETGFENTDPKTNAFSILKNSSTTPGMVKSRRPSTPSLPFSNGYPRPSTPVPLVVSKTSDSSWTLVPVTGNQSSAPLQTSARAWTSANGSRKVPAYKRLPDTQIVVDAFRYGVIPGVKAYFLSHFHSDHYMGLRKGFNMPIFCSQVTANLVHLKLRVDKEYLHILNFEEPRVVCGVEVEIFDANHCPGAVMFLFRLLDGRTFLHVGDFRAHPSMEEFPQMKHVDKLYLDTTYCDPAYDFPSQEDVVKKVVETVKYHLDQNKSTLIVCGTYTIGKEKVFMGIAEAFNLKIWTAGDKRRVLHCLENRQLLDRLTNDPLIAQVHVVAMREIALEELNKYLSKYSPRYTNIIGFKPTGWTTATSLKGKPSDFQKSTRGKVTIYGVPYSEHSSFSELRHFVRHIRPRDIQVTVNLGKSAQYKKMFQQWLSSSRDGNGQSKMIQYFASSSREPSR